MATIFKSPATASTPPVSVSSISPITGSVSQHSIKEPSAGDPLPIPERILVRQIGIVEGPDGPFGYIEADEARPYSAAALDEVLDDLRHGTYNSMPPVEPFNRPLDVSLTATTLFIFYLSNQRRWRFTRNTKAITLGEFDEPADRENYYALRHVLDDSGGSPDPYYAGNCKIVYFIAKRTSESVRHPFNINVELVYDTDSEGPNTLPIVIDPDIRYPGGSGYDQ